MNPRTCRCLRTKADYLPRRDPAAPPAQVNADSWWCALTLDSVGPDNGPVTPGECGSTRRCHEALPTLDRGEVA